MAYSFKTRLYTSSLLAENIEINLTTFQSHKIINVLRLKNGDLINLFNGEYGEWGGKIEIKKSKVKFLCLRIIKPPIIEQGPELIFSPLKQIRNDWLIEKATECGVINLFPAIMKRTVVKTFNNERCLKRIINASEQTGRLCLPVVHKLKDFKKQIDLCVTNNKVLLFCDELAEGPKISEVSRSIDNTNLTIIIGPEGGFEDKEREYIKNLKNVVICSLGPRVYRAETAAIVALSIFQ